MLVFSIFIALVHGNDKSYTYLSAEIMEEEIGINCWNILNADATCCPGNANQGSCNAEGGSSSAWFPDPNNPIVVAAGGGRCVGEAFVKCKRKGGPNACCTPNCNPPPAGSPPANPGTRISQSPPVCGPASAILQQPGCSYQSQAYNVQLILDESGSVGASNYDATVDFVKKLVTDLINKASPASLLSFSNQVDELYRFDQTQAPRDDMLSALDGAKSIAGAYQERCTDHYHHYKIHWMNIKEQMKREVN